MSKISFIVPAYNVEKYIEECINSILLQDVEKEIIIINDGSTDNTLNKCNDIKKINQEIIIISQQNKGLSAARNTGFKKAKGKYIWFVDSDDFLEPNCASKLVNICEKYNLDFIRGQYKILNDLDKKITNKFPKDCNKSFKEEVMNGKCLLNALLNNNMYEVTAWLGLFRTDYLKELKLDFLEGVTYEDHEFMLKAFLGKKDNKVMYVEEPIYIYRQRANSITKVYKLSDIDSFIKNISSMNSFISEFIIKNDNNYFKVGKKAISALYYQMTRVYGELSKDDKQYININLSKKIKFEAFLFSSTFNQKVKIFLFNYFKVSIDLFYYFKNKRRK